MSLQDLFKDLAGSDVPVVYQEFPENQNPDYIAYFEDSAHSISSDGVTIAEVKHIEIHAITKKREIYLEKYIEAILDKYHTGWQKELKWYPKHKYFDSAYVFEILEAKEIEP